MTLPTNYVDATPPTGTLSEMPATTARGINAINTQINANTTAIAALGTSKVDVASLPESVQDIVNALLVQGAGITLAYNDVANTLTITATTVAHAHSTSDVTSFTEAVQDAVAALLVEGTGIDLVYNDAAGTLTVTATGGGAGPHTHTSVDVTDAVRSVTVTTGTEARPSTTGTVLWIGGTTEPTNYDDTKDIWFGIA